MPAPKAQSPVAPKTTIDPVDKIRSKIDSQKKDNERQKQLKRALAFLKYFIIVVAAFAFTSEPALFFYAKNTHELLRPRPKTEAEIFAALDEYAAWHDQQVEIIKEKGYNATDHKYVVFRPRITGIGNGLEGFASMFIAALAMDRVLVADLEMFEFLRFLKYVKEPRLKVHPKYFDNAEPLLARSFTSDPVTGTAIADNNGPAWLCDDLNSYYPKVYQNPANIFSGSLYFYNPHLKARLEHYFGPITIETNVYHYIFKWMFQFNQDIIDEAEKYKQEHFQGKHVVGLQVRMTESYLPDEDAAKFFSCALKTAEDSGKDNIAFFIATDSYYARNFSLEALAPYEVMWASNPFHKERHAMTKPDDMHDAIIDILLLAASDDLVITPGSSFGRIAYSAIKDYKPAFLTFDSHRWSVSHPPGLCLRAKSAWPCSNRHNKYVYNTTCVPGWRHDENRIICDVS